MGRMVVALAHARIERPGEPLSWEQLVQAAWPGDRSYEDAARTRVRVMVSRIREIGLRRWLRGGEEGYLLDPELGVRFVPNM